MIVIGTAGHIDHGKSAIVQRLTGTDPDRLPEEKARGMTIDLGFAFLDSGEGDALAFVDVPGHEKFVKNMIAGAGGIDAVMLVVAADDGWMPQSQEHFQIVRYLGVRHAMIVINKIDLVERDWLDLLTEEIREKIAGSFMAEAPIFRVSARTGEGFGSLQEHLVGMSRTVEAKRDYDKARLYVDRSFIRPGIGGVVTGTLRGGSLAVGQTVSIWPSCLHAKIRSLHSNMRDQEIVTPGSRTAVSFTGVDRVHLVRGGVITAALDSSRQKENRILAMKIELMNEAPVSLVDRRRVLMINGTTETEGEIRLYGSKEIKPGHDGIVFFKPDESVYSLVGDRFILRLPTPMVSLGGGKILDHLETFPRRRDISSYEYLKDRLDDSTEALIVSELKKLILIPAEQMLHHADLPFEEIQDGIKALISQKLVGKYRKRAFLRSRLDEAVEELRKAVEAYFDAKPHLRGLMLDQLATLVSWPEDTLNVVVEYMVEKELLVRSVDKYDIEGRGVSLKGAIKQAYVKIMAALEADPFAPPAMAKLAISKDHKQAIKYIIDSGEGFKCGSDFIFTADAWAQIVRFIKETLSSQDQMAMGEMRDKFGFSRRIGIPVFEETDRIGLTRRDGDVRVKGARFEDEKFNL